MTLPTWWASFNDRIDRLHVLIPQAIEDGERDKPINARSLENAKTFAARLTHAAQPGTFIQHDGMTRLVWQSGKVEGVRLFSEQVAIKFRETDRVEFVFFRVERNDLGQSDVMGITHVDAVLDLVSALGLDHVMTRE